MALDMKIFFNDTATTEIYTLHIVGSVFLTETVRMVRAAGFEIVNASVQIIGNRPKVSTKRTEAEAALTKLVGAPVTLGATTTDGLGFLGNDEGVAAVASVLIIKPEDRLAS